MKKRIAILGSTGSIGTQTVDILDSIEAEVVSLTTNRNVKLIEEQADGQFENKTTRMASNGVVRFGSVLSFSD